jgi:hypothetical protein
MIARVDIPRSKTSSSETATLIADYAAFDRLRTSGRQYMKAFGGMAIIVLLGGMAGRVPSGQSLIVAGLLALPPVMLAIGEAIRWRRLVRRLDDLRIQMRQVAKL